jgi:hypothetical protein
MAILNTSSFAILLLFAHLSFAEHSPQVGVKGHPATQLPAAKFGDSLSFGLKDLSNHNETPEMRFLGCVFTMVEKTNLEKTRIPL